ncbi:helix-turn-helix domain-containing protein [Pseudodesulfovibrio sp. F-1]|uniref:Helix-turn-helix domain-containing protein n=1 Tax=Pseudodesulfovibrio alkaliphilus TaxID=2661613 RepID=A0A7K1KQX2_9BACT|nr:helix-turn-helix transcriptional regulator [Pseudodesulfovibrio alkaliphilus]MUM78488.1 helix-turn-helix domain-containing protein [Pseudodesulfovibrio alkaliphilus]
MGNTSLASKALSIDAARTLKQLGADIKEARVRRGMTQVELATRASTSHATLIRLERGEPSVGLGILVQVLDVLGLVEGLARVADPDTDEVGKSLQQMKSPKRVRARKRDDLDF